MPQKVSGVLLNSKQTINDKAQLPNQAQNPNDKEESF
jgi:hypothetical protein